MWANIISYRHWPKWVEKTFSSSVLYHFNMCSCLVLGSTTEFPLFLNLQPLLSPFSKTNLPYWKPAWDYSKGNLIGYMQNTSVGTSACMCGFNTFVTQVFCYLLSLFPSHPCFLCSSFTASQNILFLSMAEFRADKGVGGSGGSYIMGFSCQIGSKSFLWVHRRAERGSRFLPDFCRGNDWGLSRPHQQPVIHWLLIVTHPAGIHSGRNGHNLFMFCYLVFKLFVTLLPSSVSGKRCGTLLMHVSV